MRDGLRSAAGLVLAMALAGPVSAAPADGFSEFWTAFGAAVAKDDQAALAHLVVLGPALVPRQGEARAQPRRRRRAQPLGLLRPGHLQLLPPRRRLETHRRRPQRLRRA